MNSFFSGWQNLRERVSSPFLFSFLFSWPFSNWKITVSLVWKDPSQIEKYHFRSVYDIIEANLNWTNSFWVPLGIAILYTFFYPLLKIAIAIFNEYVAKWTTKKLKKIGLKKYIQFDKFILLEEELNSKKEAHLKVLDSKNQESEKYYKKYQEFNELQKKFNDKEAQYLLENNMQRFDGIWEVEIGPSKSNPIKFKIGMHFPKMYLVLGLDNNIDLFDIMLYKIEGVKIKLTTLLLDKAKDYKSPETLVFDHLNFFSFSMPDRNNMRGNMNNSKGNIIVNMRQIQNSFNP